MTLLLWLQTKFGVSGCTLSWIGSSLWRRPQQFYNRGILSDKLRLLCCVPHGSVLGPSCSCCTSPDVLALLIVASRHMIHKSTSALQRLSPLNGSPRVLFGSVTGWPATGWSWMNIRHRSSGQVCANSITNSWASYWLCQIQRCSFGILSTIWAFSLSVCWQWPATSLHSAIPASFNCDSPVKKDICQSVCVQLTFAAATVFLHVQYRRYLLHKLKVIQNAAACFAAGTKKSERITPVLRELCWLPVSYKTPLLVHGLAPCCLAAFFY